MLDLLSLAQAAAGGGLSPKAWLYAGFVLLVLFFLALDLGVFHKHAHAVSMREAAVWTAIWVGMALLFNVGVYFLYDAHWLGIGQNVPQLGGPPRDVHGFEAAKLFFTGYVVEKSLSMDNVFVIAMIFSYFAVPAQYQHRVLFWGILTALILRGLMIAAGAALIAAFTWIIYVFGGFLILTAIKMALFSHSEIDPSRNPLLRLISRLYPVTSEYHGQKFLVRVDGKIHATPLLLALAMVEATDVIFAVDSIPAIFAITADPFIVFTSNVFAILGLRSLYFCLAAAIEKFVYLKPALIAVLGFVGIKMLLVKTPYKLDTGLTLAVVLAILGMGVLASVVRASRIKKGGAIESLRKASDQR